MVCKDFIKFVDVLIWWKKSYNLKLTHSLRIVILSIELQWFVVFFCLSLFASFYAIFCYKHILTWQKLYVIFNNIGFAFRHGSYQLPVWSLWLYFPISFSAAIYDFPLLLFLAIENYIKIFVHSFYQELIYKNT